MLQRELTYGAYLGQIGLILVVHVLQLLSQQDPCPCQTHQHGLFLLAFRVLRHPQAFRCVTLEIDLAAHRPHSTRPARFDSTFAVTKLTAGTATESECSWQRPLSGDAVLSASHRADLVFPRVLIGAR